MQPNVINGYNLVADTATSIVNAAAATSSALTLATTNITGVWQRRIVITSSGNDTGVFFQIVGLNQALMTVSEFLQGGNATAGAVTSNQDYLKIISVKPSSSSTALVPTATAATVSVGAVGSVGSSLWQIVDSWVTPSNISFGCTLALNGATFSIQYTYDDPNNLPSGAATAAPFTHPTINAATASIDGFSNDPIFAWKLLVTGGTGTVRATGIQAGGSGP